jgi:hypothetical protein
MSDSILKRYAATRPNSRPNSENTASSPSNDNEGEDDLGAFGWLRGVRDRAVMLELRKKDGTTVAYDYALLRKVEHHPSDGITLHFSGEDVTIVGRNLNKEARPGVRLTQGILWHRVPWIQEASDAQILRAGDAALVLIERISEADA